MSYVFDFFSNLDEEKHPDMKSSTCPNRQTDVPTIEDSSDAPPDHLQYPEEAETSAKQTDVPTIEDSSDAPPDQLQYPEEAATSANGACKIHTAIRQSSRMENLEAIRKQLNCSDMVYAFYYQPNNYIMAYQQCPSLVPFFAKNCKRLAKDKSLWRLAPSPLGDVQQYTAEQLEIMTSDYCSKYFIKKTWFGRLFRGSIGDDEATTKIEVIVKTWDFFFPFQQIYNHHTTNFCDELEILTDNTLHPCLMKLKGFCCQKRLAVVYEGKPAETLKQKLYDKNFGWDDRMKVATQLAELFNWGNDRGFVFDMVLTDFIMVDKDLKIRLFDFYSLARVKDDGTGSRCFKDVEVFGSILLVLITNSLDIIVLHEKWVQENSRDGKMSIVNESLLKNNAELANNITKLALDCWSKDAKEARPIMKDVVSRLASVLEMANEKNVLPPFQQPNPYAGTS